MKTTVKRIFRSRERTQVAGLCSGAADYLELDPVLVRVIFLGVTFLTGVVPGLLTYAAAWIIVPLEPLALPSAPRATAETAPMSS